MTTRWWEFQISAPPDQADDVAAALLPLAYGGVTQEPALLLEPGDEGYAFSEDQPTLIKAYLPADAGDDASDKLVQTLRSQFPTLDVRQQVMEGEEWSRSWQRYFRIRRVGPIVVRPVWEPYEPRPGDIVISLEPGMAFGTGDHSTTRSCLRALAKYLRPGDRVLDVGTGSGVLAIAAAKLGAGDILAFDIDPLSVQATQENCERNEVLDRIQIIEGTLDHPDVKAWGKANVVLANLNSLLHIELAASILGALTPGGLMIGAGIGGQALRRVTAAYRTAGATKIIVHRQGEWRSLVVWR